MAWVGAEPDLDPARLIFIDESGRSTKMARMYGRAPRGERAAPRTAIKAAARTVHPLWEAIGDAIDAVRPQDARSFFTACGYEPE